MLRCTPVFERVKKSQIPILQTVDDFFTRSPSGPSATASNRIDEHVLVDADLLDSATW
jgi:hypothetical protein